MTRAEGRETSGALKEAICRGTTILHVIPGISVSLAPDGGLRAVFGERGGLGSSSGISLLSDLCMLCSVGFGVYAGNVHVGGSRNWREY